MRRSSGVPSGGSTWPGFRSPNTCAMTSAAPPVTTAIRPPGPCVDFAHFRRSEPPGHHERSTRAITGYSFFFNNGGFSELSVNPRSTLDRWCFHRSKRVTVQHGVA